MITVEGFPTASQLGSKLAARAPVHADLELAKIVIEVFLGLFPACLIPDRRELHGHMRPPDAFLQVAHQDPENDPKIPVGDAVAQEQQRGPRQCPLDPRWEQTLVLREIFEEIQIVILSKHQRLGYTST